MDDFVIVTEIRLHAGGYWGKDGTYVGGETHLGSVEEGKLNLAELQKMVLEKGYTAAMDSFWYLVRGVTEDVRKALANDQDIETMLSSFSGIQDVYVVRSDDPNYEGFRNNEDDRSSESEDSEEDNDSEIEPEGVAFHSDNEEIDEQNVEFHEGQVFQSRDCFKKAVDSYAIKGKLNIKYQRSEKGKVCAACVEDKCNWRIYASSGSVSNGQFVVRKLVDKHDCDWSGKVGLYTARKIADTFINEFRIEPMKSHVMKARLDWDEIKISKTKCQRAREHCFKKLEDEHVEQFSRMWDYVLQLRESNPGSTILLRTQAQVFEKFYACFYSQKQGWKNGCRRIIHVDGCHLKGRMKGQLISAVGRDSNDGMYVLAWAIVPVENKPNWEWFLELLRDDLELGSGNGISLVSDQQKGLISAVNDVCPDIEHRFCARHIWENLRKHMGESEGLRKLFWKIAKSYNTMEFENRLEELKKLRPDVHAVINQYSRHWSRAFFQDCVKSDVVDNNISESFNNVVTLERYKHVFVLLEFIRQYVMRTCKERLEEIQNYTSVLPPRIKAELEIRKRKSAKCIACPAGRGWYEIDHGRRKYMVNARGSVSCSCRQYDVGGLPCSHIIKALSEEDKNKKPEDLVHHSLTPTKWEMCYEETMKPINGINMWKRCKDVIVLPPPDKISLGRQALNKRRLESWEKPAKQSKKPKRIMTCARCGTSGHNKKRCKNMVLPKEPKPVRGRGRPKKMQSQEDGSSSQQQPLSQI